MGLGLPLSLLVLFGELPHFKQHPASLGGLTRFDVELPTLAVMVIAALALLSLPGPLATHREQGILRRLSTTPLPPAWVLAAQLVIHVALAALGLTILFAVGVAGFGVAAPKDPGALALSLLLCVAALLALGLFLAAVTRTAASVGILSALTFFPLVFLAGLWVPIAQLPSALQHISNYTPLGAAVQATQDAMQGSFPPARPLLVMAAWAVAFAVFAWRSFRWE